MVGLTPVTVDLPLGMVITRRRLRARMSRRAVGAVHTVLGTKKLLKRSNYFMKITKGVSLFASLIGGGNWNNSGYCGPSSRNGNNSATNTNTNVSARGWIRNGVYPRTAGLISVP